MLSEWKGSGAGRRDANRGRDGGHARPGHRARVGRRGSERPRPAQSVQNLVHCPWCLGSWSLVACEGHVSFVFLFPPTPFNDILGL